MAKKDFSKLTNRTDPAFQAEKEMLSTLMRRSTGQQPELELVYLDPDDIYSAAQVRTVFDEVEIQELAESIKKNGQKEAITVYPRDKQGYLIDVGERRWRACKLIGVKVKAIIDRTLVPGVYDAKSIIGQIIENDQRVELTPYDMGVALTAVKDNWGWKTKDIAEYMGRNPAYISKYLKLVSMPPSVKALMDEKIVTYVEVLNILTGIYEISPECGDQLVDDIRAKGEITRADAQKVLNGLKGKPPRTEPGSNTPGSTQDDDHDVVHPSPDPESERSASAAPEEVQEVVSEETDETPSSPDAEWEPRENDISETAEDTAPSRPEPDEMRHSDESAPASNHEAHILPIVVMIDDIEHKLLDKPSIIADGIVMIFCLDEDGREVEVAASDCKIIRVELTE